LARLEQQADLNKSTAITLPRMSFEFTGLTYDPSRKVSTTQSFTVKDPDDGSEVKKSYMPVPYNMQFELAIMCKLNDDALQITEQILPYFQPAYNLSIELVESIKEKRDVPIVLENISFQDDYEGDFSTRRVLLYTLRFTAKTYLFGPVSTATRDIIKSARVSYIQGTDTTNSVRDLTYSVVPRALKDYDGEVVTNIAIDITKTSRVIEVEDASGLSESSYIDVDGEEIFIKTITGNKLTVKRGQDGTTIADHVRGTPIKPITTADNALIEEGDDFGFSGSIG
jgi:hypothetical protein